MDVAPAAERPVPLRRWARRRGAGTVIALVTAATAIAGFWRYLVGRSVMVGTDILDGMPPWVSRPGNRPPTNTINGDTALQMTAWQQQVTDALRHGHLPLWSTLQGSGMPLLANDQSATFSPFTLLAALFPAQIGLSLAMIAKLAVAGAGTAWWVRRVGLSTAAAAYGGLVYASSSFMVVWLGWPHTSVAALIPWLLGAVEWVLAGGGAAATAVLALVVALQFLAGMAEMSLLFGVGCAVYTVVRLLDRGPARLLAAAWLAAGAGLGALLAAVQLLPFAQYLGGSGTLGGRAAIGNLPALPLRDLVSWLAPNTFGNPGIDAGLGPFPNYVEATGYVGVGGLILAAAGIAVVVRRRSNRGIALLAMAAVAAVIVYTPVAQVIGHLPGLAYTANRRFIGVICLGLAPLASFGFDAMWTRRGALRRTPALAAGMVAALGLGGVAVCGIVFAVRGAGVDRLLPLWHGRIGFWLLVAALAVGAAAALAVVAWRFGGGRPAAAGFVALALLEAALFVFPFQSRAPASDSPPHSAVVSWLTAHTGDRSVAATGQLLLIPNSTNLYGLRDVRSYDTVHLARNDAYWGTADPRLLRTAYLILRDPGVAWLARAGVAYVVSIGADPVPGTQAVYRAEGTTIGAVPQPRPYASAATAAVAEPDMAAALAQLRTDPSGPAVIEAPSAPTGAATVVTEDHYAGHLDLRVTATAATTVVVLESYDPSWRATVDGGSATVHPADVTFLSVEVPAGVHEVRLDYRPSGVTAGIALSLLGVALWVALLLWTPLRRRLARRRA